MISLIRLKKDKKFVEDLRGIIDVLKGFTATQLRAMQEKSFDRSFIKNIETAFRLLNVRYVVHPLLKETKGLPKAIAVLTPDEGFTGELTSLLVRQAYQDSQAGDEWIVLGKQGKLMLGERGQKFTEFRRQKEEEFTYVDARNLARLFIRKYLGKKISRLDFIYPKLISITKQIVVRVPLLPFHPYRVTGSIEPPRREVIIEPDLSHVVGTLIRMWSVQRINEIFWQSALAQTAARILQLESSSQELFHRAKRLHFQYFKLSHSINDRKIREILASKMA